jgi:nitroreductase
MPTISTDHLLQQLHWRYATKKFDSSKKVSATDWQALEEALILTPSSFGLQPWKFMVVTDPVIRQKLLAASWGQQQVVDCSHHIVFATRTALTEQDVDGYIQSIATTRQLSLDHPSLVGLKKMLLGFAAGPTFSAKPWATLQTYIALGNLMTCAALLGIDACPMEGIDPVKYDEILGLNGSGFATVVACAVGYRAADDKYAALAKVRFPASKVVQHI